MTGCSLALSYSCRLFVSCLLSVSPSLCLAWSLFSCVSVFPCLFSLPLITRVAAALLQCAISSRCASTRLGFGSCARRCRFFVASCNECPLPPSRVPDQRCPRASFRVSSNKFLAWRCPICTSPRREPTWLSLQHCLHLPSSPPSILLPSRASTLAADAMVLVYSPSFFFCLLNAFIRSAALASSFRLLRLLSATVR